MTTQEFADKMLADASEIAFQQKVLLEDLKWLGTRLEEYKAKSLIATDPADQYASEQELAMIRRKFKLNLDTQMGLQKKSADLDLIIEGFKKGLLA